MGDEPKSAAKPRIVAELHAAGLSDEMLKRAEETASRLCSGSGSLEGGPLDPRSGVEYHQLLASLARKRSQ